MSQNGPNHGISRKGVSKQPNRQLLLRRAAPAATAEGQTAPAGARVRKAESSAFGKVDPDHRIPQTTGVEQRKIDLRVLKDLVFLFGRTTLQYPRVLQSLPRFPAATRTPEARYCAQGFNVGPALLPGAGLGLPVTCPAKVQTLFLADIATGVPSGH